MAFLKELMNLQLSCFGHDELEEMMQWYILQRGSAKETEYGMTTHYFDKDRHLHYFHYLETKGDNQEDGLWRVDCHYDTGDNSVVALQNDLEELLGSEDGRFDTAVPAVWKVGEKMLPILMETANKNDLKNVEKGAPVAVNLNMFPIHVDIIHTKKDYNKLAKEAAMPEVGAFVPAGLLYSAMLEEGKGERDPQFEAMLQTITQEYRIVPFSFAQGVFKIKSFDLVKLGGMDELYDIVVDCEGEDLHVVAPSYMSALKDLKKGRYLNVSGFLTGMILPEEDIRKQDGENSNLLQFKKAN